MTDAADTIVAVSTAGGYAPRAVVRLSGPEAAGCIGPRFEPGVPSGGSWRRTFRATRGRLRLLGSGLRVPCVLYVMRAPRSYTRQDVVELHVPGSPALLDVILDDLVEHGPGPLRLAEPGEFTRRAFLNGRIDLAQAEAVLALIRARSESELLAAASRLQGEVGRRCRRLQEQITELRVRLEAALDFATHGIESLSEAEFLERAGGIRRSLREWASRGRHELSSDGRVHVVICGPPNAGKSSLLNRLAGRDAAIVHETPGTTRDAVGAEVEIGGICIRLSDTAGLTRAATGPDADAVDRARAAIPSARLALLVLDASVPMPPDAAGAVAALAPSRVICALNKCDLPGVLDAAAVARAGIADRTHRTSALTGEGVDGLRAALWRVVAEGGLDASAGDCLFNARQREALRRAAGEIAEAEAAVERGMGYEFAAFNLRAAAEALGEVTGRVGPQDVLDRIFSRFCIGK